MVGKMGLDQQIKELYEAKPAYNLIILVFVVIWGVAGYTVLQLSNFWLKLPFYFIIGATLNSLSILMHEAIHVKLFKNLKLNRWVGFICAAPSFTVASAYKAVHMPHHLYVRGANDPDEFENITRHPILIRLVLLVWFFIGSYFYLFHMPITGLKLVEKQERQRIIEEYLVLFLLTILVFFLVPLKFLIQIWLIPILFSAQIANIRGLSEHAFTSGDKPMTSSRTITSNWVVSFFMCNQNYHLAHHIYTGVPWYNLKNLHHLLADKFINAGSSIYSSYFLYLWDVFKVLLKRVHPPTHKPVTGYYHHWLPALSGIIEISSGKTSQRK